MKKITVFLSALLSASAVMYGSVSCGNAQIDVGSLKDCTVDELTFTNWSFVTTYTGSAMIQIDEAAGESEIDPEHVGLRFSQPFLQDSRFRLQYDITLTGDDAFRRVVQQVLSGPAPNNASVTGAYNAMSITTDGLDSGNMGNEDVALARTIHVEVIGQGAKSAASPNGKSS